MTSPAKTEECIGCGIQMGLAKWDDVGLHAAEKCAELGSRIVTQSRGENHRGLEKSGNSDDHDIRRVYGLDQALVAGLFQMHRDNCGTVQYDHDQ